MRREAFEHTLRAAADIVRDDLVVIGSQAVLGQFAEPPETLLRSLEVDVFPRSHPERAIEIDGAIGDGSAFHETYGYYAHGVAPEAVKAPAGWEARLVPLELPAIRAREGRITAWCLEIHDLILAKLAAGRPQDVEYAVEALRAGLVDEEQLRVGLELMEGHSRKRVATQLDVLVARS